MFSPPAADVTELLIAWREGNTEALDHLIPLVYSELRRLAHERVRREPPDPNFQTTALIHEAYVRLVNGAQVSWNNRAHFFAVCARLMRRILVDGARARNAEKRGGDLQRVRFEEPLAAQAVEDVEMLALDEALTRLAEGAPRRAKVVELRYFGGLTAEETAAALDISVETVARDWRMARRWLFHELRGSGSQT